MSYSIENKYFIFNYWRGYSQSHNFFLERKGTDKVSPLLFYTQRSLTREAKLLINKVCEFRHKSSILIWIAPFHHEIFSYLVNQVSDLSPLVWICIHNFSILPTETDSSLMHPSLCFSENQLEKRMRTIDHRDTITIDFHVSLQNTDYITLLKEKLNKILKKMALRLKTIQHFNKIWEYNFRANKKNWLNTDSVHHISSKKPKFFILGGSSVDNFLRQTVLDSKICIWSADTALMPLLFRNKCPNLVFSIDAGLGSFEHYIYAQTKTYKMPPFVLDPLSFPKYYTTTIKKYTYASSHPLIQQTKNPHPILINRTGDVYGIMKALYQFLFPQQNMPQVIGHDQRAIRHITHLRGSSYYYRKYHQMNRLNNVEAYFYKLSKTYKDVF